MNLYIGDPTTGEMTDLGTVNYIEFGTNGQPELCLAEYAGRMVSVTVPVRIKPFSIYQLVLLLALAYAWEYQS